MSSAPEARPRRARVGDAAVVAQLLHDFNVEFAVPTPGVEPLTQRLVGLLAGQDLVALLIGEPAVGLALLSFRASVWFNGPVAVLDELYVRPDLRGRRLGSALLDGVVDQVRGRGGELIEVNVDGDDTGARRFYAARQFSNSQPDSCDQLLYYYREVPN